MHSSFSDKRIITGIILCLILFLAVIALFAFFFASSGNMSVGPYIEWADQHKATIMLHTKTDKKLELELYQEGVKKPIHRVVTNAKKHIFNLNALSPDTLYSYRIKGKGIDENRQFRTLPSTQKQDLSFIVYGNSGNKNNLAIRTRMLESFAIHQPSFIIHTGNLLSGDNEESTDYFGPDWRLNVFTKQFTDTMSSIPVYRVKGPHDTDRPDVEQAYINAFPSQEKNHYSVAAGNLLLLCLNNTASGMKNYNAETRRWLDQEVSKYPEAKWKILLLSSSPWEIKGKEANIQELKNTMLEDLIRNGIDMVFTGKAANYSRLKPLSIKGMAGNPVIFISSGGGGAKLENVKDNKVLARGLKEFHFCVADMTENMATLQVFDDKNKLLDKIKIIKDASGGMISATRTETFYLTP